MLARHGIGPVEPAMPEQRHHLGELQSARRRALDQREQLGEAVAGQGLAAATPALKALLGQILSGRA